MSTSSGSKGLAWTGFAALLAFPIAATWLACSDGNSFQGTSTGPGPGTEGTTTDTTTTGTTSAGTTGTTTGTTGTTGTPGPVGSPCTTAQECQSLYCDAATKLCAAPPPCNDLVKNGTETDVDCGGLTCGKCSDGRACATGADCKSTFCSSGKCVAQLACANGTKDGQETDVDCGGASCGGCAYKKACAVGTDCVSGVCDAGTLTCACPLGSVDCNGVCVDLTADKGNCSACAAACATTYCQNSTCTNTCAAPAVDCNGKCVQLNTAENCGKCGNTCTSSQVCSGGVCTDKATITDVGCADGQREAFTDKATFPNVAGCAGAWSVPGLFPAPLRSNSTGAYKVATCATNGDDSPAPGPGTDCTAADLCAPGWHVCKAGELAPRTNSLNCAALPAGEASIGFFAASVSGTGCGVCAPITGSNVSPTTCTSVSCATDCHERADLSNDIFGCGGPSIASATCELGSFSNDQCGSLGAGWSCPSSTNEGGVVKKTESSGGGVLCCR